MESGGGNPAHASPMDANPPEFRARVTLKQSPCSQCTIYLISTKIIIVLVLSLSMVYLWTTAERSTSTLIIFVDSIGHRPQSCRKSKKTEVDRVPCPGESVSQAEMTERDRIREWASFPFFLTSHAKLLCFDSRSLTNKTTRRVEESKTNAAKWRSSRSR